VPSFAAGKRYSVHGASSARCWLFFEQRRRLQLGRRSAPSLSNYSPLQREYVGSDGAGCDRVQLSTSGGRLPHHTAG
jgi:hypothetical protein